MTKFVDRLIYALIIVLSLTALWLLFNTPADFLNARVIYQGF